MQEVRLYLPRFEMEHSLGLAESLQAMGMPLAFDEARADFSAMADLRDGARLFISDVLHKAFVAVDEEGSSAYRKDPRWCMSGTSSVVPSARVKGSSRVCSGSKARSHDPRK